MALADVTVLLFCLAGQSPASESSWTPLEAKAPPAAPAKTPYSLVGQAPGTAKDQAGHASAAAVILDDRATRDQAPPRFLARAAQELSRRKGIVVLRMSEARKRLDARANRALTGCGDDPGCLAAAAREAGGDIVVTVRLTTREGAFFLAVTRTNALRPQVSDDEATLAGTEDDALRWLPEAIGELFADAELGP